MATGMKTGGRRKGTPNKATPADAGAAGAAPGGALLPSIKTRARPTDPALPHYRVERTDTLVPYANNARTHSAVQVAKIAASIKEFGFTNPVLVDGKRGIIAGHGRVLAARALNMGTVPVIELSHLSAAQRRAYVIADNRLAEDGSWDEELLRLELGELQDAGFDLSLSGFDAGELTALFDEPDLPETTPERSTEKTVTCPACQHEFAP